MAILTVGYLSRAPYEYSHHIKIGQDFGLIEADIRALLAYLERGDASDLPPLTRVVADAARELTAATALSQPVYDALRAELSPELLVDLVSVIAFYTAVVRVLGAFEVDVEAEYQGYLDAFPLPGDGG